MKSIKPLLAFIVCLWALAVVAYAKQVGRGQRTPDSNRTTKAILMQAATSCGGTSSGDPGQ